MNSAQSLHPNFRPFLAVLYTPRHAIDELIAAAPRKHVLLLASLYGMSRFVDNIFDKEDNPLLSPAAWMVLAIVLGPPIGIAIMYIYGFLASSIGRWLGGVATAENMRTVFAWSLCPTLAFVPFAVIFYIVAGPNQVNLSNLTPETMTANQAIGIFLLMIMVLGKMFFIVWSLTIHFVMMMRVHQFGFWKSFLSGILSSLIMLIIVVALLVILGVILFILAMAGVITLPAGMA